MDFLRFQILCLALLALAAAPHANARQNFGAFTIDAATKTEIQIYTPFDRVPPRGYLPVRVKIRNGFSRERTWTFFFDSSVDDFRSRTHFRSTFRIDTSATSESEHDLMVPLCSVLETSVYNTQVEVRVAGRNGQVYSTLQQDWVSVAMSQGVDNRGNLDRFNKTVESSIASGLRGEPAAALFDPADLMADWRGYSGFDVIFMTGDEWQTLEPAVRRSILAWNRLGGNFYLFSSTAGAKPDSFGIEGVPLPNTAGTVRRHLGLAGVHPWNDGNLDGKSLLKLAQQENPNLNQRFREEYTAGWSLQTLFGTRAFNPVLVFLILIAFAVVVGPINLFVLAKPGMRHRLFFTTPIISLAASLLLISLIVFQDGFGGTGRRAAVMMLEYTDREHRAFLVQEQISRTGVLLNRAFSLEDPTFMSPVVMSASRWTHIDDSNRVSASFEYEGNTLSGDWFQSRREQAHFATTVRPTRARIDRLPDSETGAPRLFSSIDLPIEKLFYTDKNGAIWQSSGTINAGQEIVLQEASRAQLNGFWKDARTPLSDPLNNEVERFTNLRDTYLAISHSPGDHLIDTLGSIRWRNDHLLLTGTPASVNAQPQPES